ncbi:putative homeobox-leucine zipper protein ROC8-like [Capsicum annuum]|nr:putative homeobox-leucine zipper protein ROC8-like [Capsicum annuum]
MKKETSFEWDQACSNAFESIKSYLMKPPVLVAPILGKPLILYIAAQERSVGALLAQENSEGKENSLYYLSRMMTPNELKYSPIKGLYLALAFSIQKMKHYLQAHIVRLLSRENPIKFFEIVYIPQKAVKGQALADFLADHPIPDDWELSDKLPDEDAMAVEPINDYLCYGILPEDPRRKTDIHRRAPRFLYYKDTLYRRSFEGVILRCLGKEEAIQALQEALLRVCGSHQSGPKLYFHIKRIGYYWTTMVKDCLDYARRYKACQFHANFIHQPPEYKNDYEVVAIIAHELGHWKLNHTIYSIDVQVDEEVQNSFADDSQEDSDKEDPPPRKINEHSKKKQKVDSSTPVAKKPLRKKKVNEHTQTRTPAPRAAKTDRMKTPVFKPISTRQASYSKTKKGKQTARVIFPHIQSKLDIHVEKVAVSKPESHVEKEAFISKKDFDAFRDEEQVIDIEADKSNIDGGGGGVEKSGQHFNPDVVQSSNNISDDKDPNLHNMNYVGTKRSPQQLSLQVDQELKANILGRKMNREITDLSSNSLVNSEVELATEERVRKPPNTQEVTNDEQRDEQLWLDSQNTIPDEFLPSLNVYDKKSIMIHPSANREVKNPRPKLRIRRPSKFKESPYTKKFGSAAERCIFLYDSYESSGHYAAVLAEIEKIAKIIPFYLQACDFYVKKGIDLQNHPRYKDKEFSNMFDILFKDDLSQQPSGSLDCGVFMVMYAEYLSYGHKVITNEFDPNALRTRYAALLWDYGI